MRRARSTVVVVAALSFGSGASARAQVQIQPGGPTGSVQIDPSGNLVVDGHCFGNVTPLPTGPTIKIFGGLAVAGRGDVFFSGPLDFGSSTFPGGIVIRTAGTAIASFASVPDVSTGVPKGLLYAAGRCANTSGFSNTKWEPAPWNSNPDYNNCYTYALDMNFQDTLNRGPGYVQDGPLKTGPACDQDPLTCTMAIHTDGAEIGLIERVEDDGLVLAKDPITMQDLPVYPDTPVMPAGGNAYSCPNRGHLVFMLVEVDQTNASGNRANDYHFLRLDQENGSWSYKDGVGNPVYHLDGNGDPIVNPLQFNTLPHHVQGEPDSVDIPGRQITGGEYYSDFVNAGFFCAPGGKVVKLCSPGAPTCP